MESLAYKKNEMALPTGPVAFPSHEVDNTLATIMGQLCNNAPLPWISSFLGARMPPTSVPVINIDPLINEKGNRQEIVDHISAACRDWGFFQIIGHDISPELISRL